MKRAIRRLMLQNKKKKSCSVYKSAPNAVKYANHMKTCSCFMCGNPRKWFGQKTRQEKISEYDLND